MGGRLWTPPSTPLINGDLILAAECEDGDVNLFGMGPFSIGPVSSEGLWIRFGFGKLYRPTGISILLGKFAGTLLPVFRNIPALCFSSLLIRCLGACTIVASTI